MFLLVRLLVGLLGIGMGLYMTVVSDNRLTRLRMRIPKITQEVKELEEKNETLAFAIASFLQPHHLFTLSSSPDLAHLKPSYTPPLVCPINSKQEAL